MKKIWLYMIYMIGAEKNLTWFSLKKKKKLSQDDIDLLLLLLSYTKTRKLPLPYKKHYLPASVFKKKLRNVCWKISVGAISRPMSAIDFSIQSLNEICMMSVRKCSIGVIRWCFFFRPRSVIFPDRRRLSFFSVNIGEKYFFAEIG